MLIREIPVVHTYVFPNLERKIELAKVPHFDFFKTLTF